MDKKGFIANILEFFSNDSSCRCGSSDSSVSSLHDPMVPVPFTVIEAWEEYPGCNTFIVKPKDAQGSCDFKPGQFHMIYKFGCGEIPISNCSDSGDTENLIFTVMNVGEVSASLCALKKGDQIDLRGPFGSVWPIEQAKGKDVVIVSGGLGLPPVRPVIYHILKNRADFGNVSLLHGARTPDHLVYTDELKQWAKREDLHLALTVDDAGEADWSGNVGLVTALIDDAPFDPANTVAITCGPEIMMKFVVAELQEKGMSSDDIYVSMERNMKCAVGLCGRCQYGKHFVCKDGPVFPFADIKDIFAIEEV